MFPIGQRLERVTTPFLPHEAFSPKKSSPFLPPFPGWAELPLPLPLPHRRILAPPPRTTGEGALLRSTSPKPSRLRLPPDLHNGCRLQGRRGMKGMPSRCRRRPCLGGRVPEVIPVSPQSAAAGCPSSVRPLRTTGHLSTSTPRLSRLLPSRLGDPVVAALVGEHGGGGMDVVTPWCLKLVAGRNSTLGPRRLPSLHLFLVVLIRHSAVPGSSMKKPRRKADQQCTCSTRTSQPDVYMIQANDEDVIKIWWSCWVLSEVTTGLLPSLMVCY